ncbi:HalOD1 output domain-containing protein [Halobellus sp. GM3]|uniref:HalOD1 output domain-containing protein n=1 Tax=Halobellus sp. GM3 TaxID=3458410 RepID=UPI00403D7A66
MTRNATETQFEMRGQYARPDTYYAQHDFDGPAKLSTTVVHTISEVANADITRAESALFQHVNPEALDALFTPAGSDAPRTSSHVNLHIWGYGVTVYSNGQIVISAPERRH